MWYEKYYNKITLNDNFYEERNTGKLYFALSKAIHPRGQNNVRWYEYFQDEDMIKPKRMTKNLRYNFIFLTRKLAEEKYPEYFI